MSYIFFFHLVCFLKDLCIVQGRVLVPFISRKKPLWLQFDQLNSWKGPPLFIPLPERNIKLSVFPSDMRTEISSLSIKMSRYFISVPVGPEALTLFNVALLYSSLMCSLFLHPSLPLSTFSLPAARSALAGVYAAGPAPQWDWRGLEPQVKLLISISGLGDWSWVMLQTLNSGQLQCLLFGGKVLQEEALCFWQEVR